MDQTRRKNVDGVLGTRTQGDRIVGADESTELRRHPVNQEKKVWIKVWFP